MQLYKWVREREIEAVYLFIYFFRSEKLCRVRRKVYKWWGTVGIRKNDFSPSRRLTYHQR